MAELDSRLTGLTGRDPSLPTVQATATSAPDVPGQQPSPSTPAQSPALTTDSATSRADLGPLVGYFLKLGAIGFGGPAALVGFMHRDLVERRQWIDEAEYKLALGLAQIMPGPLAAQLAIALGYFQHGVVGATAVGGAFILPSFLMVVAISMAYVTFGGLGWM